MDVHSHEQQPEVIPLWPGGAPASEGEQHKEEETVIPPGPTVIRNVSQPTLTAYLPSSPAPNATAVIICPGGAYHFLAIDLEGSRVARWLNGRGIGAFVLKYRLIPTGDDFPAVVWSTLRDPDRMAAVTEVHRPRLIADGLQAVRLVRARAAEWGIAAHRIGMMGFSAGGMLTANVALSYEPASRPDFAAAIYPAEPEGHPVPAHAPPLFVLCASGDAMAAPISLRLFSQWRAAGRPAELHVYQGGDHGFGMDRHGLPVDTWIDRFADWLDSLDLPERPG